ncbi:hypothetical protein FPSE_06724 [Fusarium pseudograminearum CS3096]|uniref:Glycogen debranching enzyme n=1 Tax=Fusarium pseudograminearum (strain CS3096) TaxID=1028729 RepID=K3ULW1_FUSPC|nr:hypothetical protein FPSE_06724 [Fusarium pseudograminearum CS3096]EKJ73111.1 hypothetical protein FPSE_06724 [Fusarium pseudograminearum CS3096]
MALATSLLSIEPTVCIPVVMAPFIAVLLTVIYLTFALGDSCPVITQQLSDPPYENYFYSDCNTDAQVVVTSPLPDSNLSIIGPRLIVAWPAGNSGICTFFEPQNEKNGTLAIELVNSTVGSPLGVINRDEKDSEYPFVGVEGVLSFNTSASLTVAILGSIRNIRDFTEGPSILSPVIQNATNITRVKNGGILISRLWLDNITTTNLLLEPWENKQSRIAVEDETVSFGSGFYRFAASFNYPQLKQLSPQQVLNNQSRSLIKNEESQVRSLSFFSYIDKLLAGGWRFLTYFGRDTMIAALLLEPVLSAGNSSALEAVIGAVLERINRTDGSVCHEETIGDYATFLNLQKGIVSTAPGFTYPMIDTDFFLPILMDRYFSTMPNRVDPLLRTKAGEVDVENRNLTWGNLSYINAQKIMNITEAFEKEQAVKNLIQLKKGELVGQWRDSTYGLANGRIPFDVNCALVPAALYAISKLAKIPGVYPNNSVTKEWSAIAEKRAKIWEDNTLPLFEYNVTVDEATLRLEDYVDTNTFYDGPTNAKSLTNYSSSGRVVDYAIAINTTKDQERIHITHTDTAFRLFLLNSTNDEQLTTFMNATANAILRPFPAGLSTPFGIVVANPALADNKEITAGFTNSAYHGTVVWSWQLALMAKGLERQLARCPTSKAKANDAPVFCTDDDVHKTVRLAYNHLWDIIEDNSERLQSEVWSWSYSTKGDYRFAPLGTLPPPPGLGSGTESNVRQLWSLTFLAVKRNKLFA